MKYVKFLILLIFFLSGVSGLVYEIVWIRLLSHVFGVSSFAVSTVLTVFMAGLGIGGYIFGRLIDNKGDPLKVYALLEILTGLYAISLPYLIKSSEWLYIMIYNIIGGSFIFLSIERFILSFFILIFPTIMMGGTLPVISRFLIRSEDRVGIDSGIIYSLNTFGAVVGCAVTGFYLIESIGINNSLYSAAFLNFFAGAGAYIISQKSEVWGTHPVDGSQNPEFKTQNSRLKTLHSELSIPHLFVLITFGFSGMAALSYEVLWTRLLILILDNTIYAFSIILFTFLLGIAGGSFIFAKIPFNPHLSKGERGGLNRERIVTIFALFQILIGLMGLLSLLLFAHHNLFSSWLNIFISWSLQSLGIGYWWKRLFATFLMAFLIMIIPTLFMGASFPAISTIYLSDVKNVGKGIGKIYLINTIGAIIGSFSSGFIILPILGIQKAIIVVGSISLIFGITIIFLNRRNLSRYVIPVSSIIAGIIIIGFILKRGDIPRLISVEKLDLGNEVLYYKEGITGTVLVSSQETDLTPQRKPVKRLWINGDPIAGEFRGALQLERLQAHLPLMFHNDPKSVLVICFGTGSTAGAVSDHRVEEVYAVDISKEVFESGRYFSEGNRNILADPRLKMIIEDGRNFLLTTDKKFDFITSEPPPPSNAGIVNLYSREYYLLCKSRLKSGGMVSQWIPLHHLSEDDFRMLVSTFVSVFPNSTMWFTKWDAIMIGSDSKLTINLERLKGRFQNKRLAESLKEIGISNPYQLLSTFIMDKDNLSQFVNRVPVVTDDRPYVEFTAPRVHHIGTTIKGRNLENMLKYRKPVTPLLSPPSKEGAEEISKEIERYFNSHSYFLTGQVSKNDNRIEDSLYNYKKALDINSENSDARYELINLYMNKIYTTLYAADKSKGFKLINECMELDVNGEFSPQLHNLRGLFFLSKKDTRMALNEFEYALKLDDKYLSPYLNIGSIYAYYEVDPLRSIDYYSRGLKLRITEQERNVINSEIEKVRTLYKDKLKKIEG
ncbi:MAG: fused MFS/spermidine synthase [Nitrospinae bacterium]|nr:fused MFS/spermidine synthase [Nitrospinota bacterium]